MPWARVADDLFSHPKMLRLIELLKCKTADAYLVRLWCWTLAYGPGGDLSRFDNLTIARGCGWPGDADRLIESLYVAGFLDVREGEAVLGRVPAGARRTNGGGTAEARHAGDVLTVHDWQDHSGRYELDSDRGRARVQKHRERLRNANTAVTFAEKEEKEGRKEDPEITPRTPDPPASTAQEQQTHGMTATAPIRSGRDVDVTDDERAARLVRYREGVQALVEKSKHLPLDKPGDAERRTRGRR